MKKRSIQFLIFISLSVLTGILLSGCSSDISSYEELEKTGKTKSVAEKKYKKFFKTIKKLSLLQEISLKDSLLVRTAEKLSREVRNDTSEFPSTIKSRIALDAVSFACEELNGSKILNKPEIYPFWRDSLFTTIYTTGRNFMEKGDINESAHLQVVKAVRRSIGSQVTDDTVLSILPIIGVSPSAELFKYCDSDTLFLKKIHDLIIYSRSLQKTDPPVWMLSGVWFAGVSLPMMSPIFISFVPNMIEGAPYISFKDYNLGEVYAEIFKDPVPKDESKWKEWLDRADKTLKSISYDSAFAKKVEDSSLPVYDAHNFFGNYLIHTDIDTLKKEFLLSLSKGKATGQDMSVAGSDSISFVFPERYLVKPDSIITPIKVTRITGSSVIQGQIIPASQVEGTAYFMPMGKRKWDIINQYRELNSKGKFKVDVKVN